MTISRVGSDGFTLIELALVAATIGVLMVSAAPHVQRGWSSMQTEQAAFAVAQSLRTARTLAITQNHEMVWRWDDDRLMCVGKAPLMKCPPLGVPAPRLERSRPIPDSIQLALQPPNQQAQRISFFPNGTSQPTTTVVVSDNLLPRYHITVEGPTSLVAVHAGAPPSTS